MAESTVTDLIKIRDERDNAQFWLSDYDTLVRAVSEWHDRIKKVDHVARGEFPSVDGFSGSEKPKVPNIVELVLRDRPALASSVMPTIRVDPANEKGRVKAEKR